MDLVERGVSSLHDIEDHAIHLLSEYRTIDAYIGAYTTSDSPLFDLITQLECERLLNRAELLKSEIGRGLELVKLRSNDEYRLLWNRYVMDTPVKEMYDIMARNGVPMSRRAYELLRNRAMADFIRLCRVELLQPMEEDFRKKKRGRKSNVIFR